MDRTIQYIKSSSDLNQIIKNPRRLSLPAQELKKLLEKRRDSQSINSLKKQINESTILIKSDEFQEMKNHIKEIENEIQQSVEYGILLLNENEKIQKKLKDLKYVQMDNRELKKANEKWKKKITLEKLEKNNLKEEVCEVKNDFQSILERNSELRENNKELSEELSFLKKTENPNSKNLRKKSIVQEMISVCLFLLSLMHCTMMMMF